VLAVLVAPSLCLAWDSTTRNAVRDIPWVKVPFPVPLLGQVPDSKCFGSFTSGVSTTLITEAAPLMPAFSHDALCAVLT